MNILRKINKLFESAIVDLDLDRDLDYYTLINQWKKQREVDQVRRYGKVKYPVEDTRRYSTVVADFPAGGGSTLDVYYDNELNKFAEIKTYPDGNESELIYIEDDFEDIYPQEVVNIIKKYIQDNLKGE